MKTCMRAAGELDRFARLFRAHAIYIGSRPSSTGMWRCLVRGGPRTRGSRVHCCYKQAGEVKLGWGPPGACSIRGSRVHCCYEQAGEDRDRGGDLPVDSRSLLNSRITLYIAVASRLANTVIELGTSRLYPVDHRDPREAIQRSEQGRMRGAGRRLPDSAA